MMGQTVILGYDMECNNSYHTRWCPSSLAKLVWFSPQICHCWVYDDEVATATVRRGSINQPTSLGGTT